MNKFKKYIGLTFKDKNANVDHNCGCTVKLLEYLEGYFTDLSNDFDRYNDGYLAEYTTCNNCLKEFEMKGTHKFIGVIGNTDLTAEIKQKNLVLDTVSYMKLKKEKKA